MAARRETENLGGVLPLDFNMPSPAKNFTPPVHRVPYARVLIVDDDPEIRRLHARVLTLEGYVVETAEDGADALERLAEEDFDLVLTDKQMPNLDGTGIVLALRSAGSQIPVVMVSGSLARHPLPESVAGEIFVALPKPARITEIISAVALALHSTSERRHTPARRNIHFSEA